jgi:thiol-disulfide isomerase/thioredoxin
MKRLIQVTSLLLACLAAAAAAQQVAAPTAAQQVATPPTPAPTPPPRDNLRFIRMKISAGDLPSAESILEVHRADKGEDGEYLLGLAWLARGAVLVEDWPAASRHAKAARSLALSRLGTPPVWEQSSEAQYALGTAIEVEAQALVHFHKGKKAEALRYLDASSKDLATAPYNLRARVWKRRNQIELVGQKAPAIRADDGVGPAFSGLEPLRGKPVVVYLWWEACGDCRMQAAAFRRTVEKYAPKGVAFVAPTRYYEEDHTAEKAKIEKSWKETYGLADTVAAPISDEAMLRYGASATPTFVFVDRSGVVRQYLPYRMTDERLAAEIEALLGSGL